MFHLSGIILSDYGIFALSHLIDSFRLICNHVQWLEHLRRTR